MPNRIVLSALSAVVAALALTGCSSEPPSDQECMAMFQEHMTRYAGGETTQNAVDFLRESGCDERMARNVPPPAVPTTTVTAAPTTTLAAPTATVATPTTTTAPAAPTRRKPTPTTAARPRNNAERDWSCDQADDGVPVCEGNVPDSVGKYRTPKQEMARQGRAESNSALKACMEQTGMTREQCIADAAAGNAS
jgi:hypothetical protein